VVRAAAHFSENRMSRDSYQADPMGATSFLLFMDFFPTANDSVLRKEHYAIF